MQVCFLSFKYTFIVIPLADWLCFYLCACIYTLLWPEVITSDKSRSCTVETAWFYYLRTRVTQKPYSSQASLYSLSHYQVMFISCIGIFWNPGTVMLWKHSGWVILKIHNCSPRARGGGWGGGFVTCIWEYYFKKYPCKISWNHHSRVGGNWKRMQVWRQAKASLMRDDEGKVTGFTASWFRFSQYFLAGMALKCLEQRKRKKSL